MNLNPAAILNTLLPQAAAEQPVAHDATPAAPVASAADVIDLEIYGDKKMATMAILRACGIIRDDTTQTELLLMKRINRALYEDGAAYSEAGRADLTRLQESFKVELQQALTKENGYEEFVANGRVNALLNDYLQIKINEEKEALRHLTSATDILSEEEKTSDRLNKKKKDTAKQLKQYEDERKNYQNPAWGVGAVKEAALKYQSIVTCGECLSTGMIAARSGAVHADLAYAEDIVSDTLGIVNARSFKQLLSHFASDDTLASYAANPQGDNVTRIKALADDIAASTQPVSSFRDFESETPQLNRIVALKALVSAQLHHAFVQERTPEDLLKIEKEARQRVKGTAQAAMSLAYHFLNEGPSAQDPRVRQIQMNLAAEMKRDGMDLLPAEEAQQRTASIAREAAENLRLITQGTPEMDAKVTLLAEAAGVAVKEAPLTAKSGLIGIDLSQSLQTVLSDPHTLVTPTSIAQLAKALAERASGSQPTVAA